MKERSQASWAKVFRHGFAPHMKRAELEALLDGLEKDDPTLTQGSTCTPPPLQVLADWPIEACDAITYGSWKTRGLEDNTTADCESKFANMCYLADQKLGDPAGCRFFLNWFDDCPRDEMRLELAAEIREILYDMTSQVVDAAAAAEAYAAMEATGTTDEF